LQALAVVGETSGNWVLANAMHRVQDSVRSGRSVAGPLADEPIFPQMVVQMIAVGEDSGSLDTMLGKVADFYDEEVQATTESLTSLIEPLMIALIGVIVGGMIVALYLPMFSVFSAITGGRHAGEPVSPVLGSRALSRGRGRYLRGGQTIGGPPVHSSPQTRMGKNMLAIQKALAMKRDALKANEEKGFTLIEL